ncbi:chemotaxis protein CheD [Metabacillus herbersteinensis]|uniref:Probable chemoreceptor glutamine deamidase CheD n=1 Tax=Metabacillus herbersteinensis TaxID=283816 RepID=A0ABV6GCL5_9BACI
MLEILDVVKVGIADLNVVKAPERIRTSGLGSCVGLILYDQLRQIAGLAHIMLPDSTLGKIGSINDAKYADTAVKKLIKDVVTIGAKEYSLKAKIAGGAQMFQFQTSNDLMRIGPRNVEAIKEQLKLFHIPLVSEDVGGSSGRTIEFDPSTCDLVIKTVNQGTKTI